MMLEPYYSQDGIDIYHGEALSVLESLPTASVCCLIADPPYSSGGLMRSDRNGQAMNKYRGFSHSPDETRPPERDTGNFSGDSRDQRSYGYWSALWMSQACRLGISGAQFFTFTDWRQLPITTDSVQAGGWVWRGILIWDKGIGRPMKGRFRNHLEYLVWASNGPMPEAKEIYPSTLLRHAPPTTERIHLTQKPESLIIELLTVAPDGQVLDPFMGSGTTLVAAKQLGRKAVGIEIEEKYCEIAVKRLAQMELFAPVSKGG